MQKLSIRIALLVTLTGVFGTSIAHADALRSRDYTCAELSNQLERDGTLTFKVLLGQRTVYTEPEPCETYKFYAVRPAWRTSDTWHCVLGYACNRKFHQLDGEY